MSRGNEISLIYRGGSEGRFVITHLLHHTPDRTVTKSQGSFLTQFRAKIPSALFWHTEWPHLWIIWFYFQSNLRNVQLVCRQASSHSPCSWAQWVRLTVVGAVGTFLPTQRRLDHGVMVWRTLDTVTGCSVLVRAPKVFKAPSAEEGGYVNMWLHTCNNTMSTFYTHRWTPGSSSLAESAFICLHSLIWQPARRLVSG